METIDMPTTDRTRERGQLLVIFAIALVAVVGTVGLVIDGGSTFVQRRAEQNVADAAAMAAGYAYLLGTDITVAAHTVAAANGYTDGVDNTTVTVTQSADDITVTVTRPHQNYFAGVLGFASWDVTTTATVRAGIPNGAYGAMPLLFNIDAFNDPGNRKPNTGAFDEPGTGTEDVPQGTSQFNWTVFCTASGNPCNGNSSDVSDIIAGEGTDTTIYLNDDIGPLNAGARRGRWPSSTTTGASSAGRGSRSPARSAARRSRSAATSALPPSTQRPWSSRRPAAPRSRIRARTSST
jgi:hypothetical protein